MTPGNRLPKSLHFPERGRASGGNASRPEIIANVALHNGQERGRVQKRELLAANGTISMARKAVLLILAAWWLERPQIGSGNKRTPEGEGPRSCGIRGVRATGAGDQEPGPLRIFGGALLRGATLAQMNPAYAQPEQPQATANCEVQGRLLQLAGSVQADNAKGHNQRPAKQRQTA